MTEDPRIAKLIAEIKETEAEQQRILERMAEIDAQRKAKLAETKAALDAHREHIGISRHEFQGELRDGLLNWGYTDRHIDEIVRASADGDAEKVIEAVGKSTDDEILDLYSLIRYIQTAGVAVARHRNLDFTSVDVDSLLWDDPHSPESLGVRASIACALFKKAFLKYVEDPDNEDVSLAAVLTLSIRATLLYHKMSLSLVERDALYRIKEGQRSKASSLQNSGAKAEALSLAMDFLNRRAGTGRPPTISATARHVLRHMKSQTKPGFRTLHGWISDLQKSRRKMAANVDCQTEGAE